MNSAPHSGYDMTPKVQLSATMWTSGGCYPPIKKISMLNNFVLISFFNAYRHSAFAICNKKIVISKNDQM